MTFVLPDIFLLPGRRGTTRLFFLSIFGSGSADMAFSGAAFVPSSLVALLHARLCIARMGL